MTIADVAARPLVVPTPPESFLQLVQWHWLTRWNGSVTSNRTPPQRQLPVISAMSAAYPVPVPGTWTRTARPGLFFWDRCRGFRANRDALPHYDERRRLSS